MEEDTNSIVNEYGKETNKRYTIEFVDLIHTGSADSRENQIVKLRVSKEAFYDIRKLYRHDAPHGIKDFESVELDEGEVEIYLGGSYGSSTLLSAVGTLLESVD